jgi:hypothetical protein
LGQNDLLPDWPVGKQLAFDPKTSRLWAVCPSCDRWNLSPLEEPDRQAAVAKLEHYFAATPSRAAAAGIGIAELPGRGSLVRIGDATWPQFAAWRYGRRLGQRRWRYLALMALMLAITIYLWTPAGDAMMDSLIGFWAVTGVLYYLVFWRHSRRPLRSIILDDGRRSNIRVKHAIQAQIVTDQSGWRLLVPHDKGTVALTGADAVRTMALLYSALNMKGAKPEQQAEAIDHIDLAGGPERMLGPWLATAQLDGKLHAVPATVALALEMAANEQAERQFLHGSLAKTSIERADAEVTASLVERLG